ncbi:hypothetical protein CJU94_25400 [Paraburkholderia aromaticivorans]|uniref:Uncharacterized protein n=1 Tax=Paraburkholderia aromaticivorans TaxID=2026199 RepID=A0A248VR43_9BURK|nr:hypothetical protein CJU94_25400 [Paraburkholderia aromaticivorans]
MTLRIFNVHQAKLCHFQNQFVHSQSFFSNHVESDRGYPREKCRTSCCFSVMRGNDDWALKFHF